MHSIGNQIKEDKKHHCQMSTDLNIFPTDNSLLSIIGQLYHETIINLVS